MQKRIVLCLLFLCGLAGCAPKRLPLQSDHASKVSSLLVESTAYEKLVLRYRVQTGGGEWFGLLGALADAATNSRRAGETSDAALALEAALLEVDLRGKLWDRLEMCFAQSEWPPRSRLDRRTERPRDPQGTLLITMLNKVEEDALLTLQSSYYLTPDGLCLGLSTEAKLTLDTGKPVYRSQYHFLSDPLSVESPYDAWAADGASLFLAEFERALNATQHMLERDLLDIDRLGKERPQGGIEYLLAGLGTPEPLKFQGQTLEAEDGYRLIRSTRGYLFTLGDALAEAASSKHGWRPLESR